MTRPASTRTDPLVGGASAAIAGQTAPPTASKNRHHFGHHTIHHSQFAKTERGDAGIAFHVKQAIIEKSPTRLQSYEPREVAVRTDQKYSLKDSSAVKTEKLKRRTDVYRCGFCSDAKESYKPLGDPILDSDALLCLALKIDPTSLHRLTNTKDDEVTSDANEVHTSSRRIRLAGPPPRHNNGFELIKDKLVRSKGRIHAVKFGIPFAETVDDSDWRHRIDAAKIGRRDGQLQEGQVDWYHRKLDTDKQAYFQSVLERELPGFIGQRSKKGSKCRPATSVHLQVPDRTAGPIAGWQRSKETPEETPVTVSDMRKEELPNLSLAPPTISPSAPKSSAIHPKAMEQVLSIRRDDGINLATDQYYTTRERFYEERRRLTQVLLEDLNRMDFERKSNFIRKFRSFKVGKNTMCSDDIAAMRNRAEAQRQAEKNRLLQQHPWYNELLNKVVLNGVKRDMSEYEELLLNRVKCVIEDNLPFTQNTFVQLMKIIPTHEFMKDDIQRIIRFVKAHANITEREYLEAMDMALV
ncbi:uncharacterized protein SPPG_03318 [Spizellomyces punctatus DAOM BR117]|uniref:Uncharacterized protein n=1 Tax=Spizellomyces punctatus (strain DAOM BR117) TaxID=645134 RepID=A0A0L0HL02_SPIPD|nr:uncharacterized protein SPPG_03318 [Spizellomyces punctatus DAOM BR117]KND01519.1 hypothetical protein SPPG_03318 [Spizellomyces punctatus DAOM BR117]|eukprot:XP_016609558.1 hypothetical protein SPPG_03318 [Spizellomyces punctatus DAOM BR117]